jgi:hypothetical protein
MGDLYNLADLTNKVGRDRWARRGRPSGPSLPAVPITNASLLAIRRRNDSHQSQARPQTRSARSDDLRIEIEIPVVCGRAGWQRLGASSLGSGEVQGSVKFQQGGGQPPRT